MNNPLLSLPANSILSILKELTTLLKNGWDDEDIQVAIDQLPEGTDMEELVDGLDNLSTDVYAVHEGIEEEDED